VVNGSPIKKHFLQNNDIVELGKYKLKFVAEAGGAASAGGDKADFEKTMVLRPAALRTGGEALRSGTGGPQRAAAVPQAATTATAAAVAGIADPKDATKTVPPGPPPAAPRPAGQPLGAIQLLSGANAGKELELTKPLTTLGKPGVQVAVLTRRPQGYFITHVEGAARPNVNGQQIGPAPHALKDHDVIELAGVKMEFFLKA
jgi:hypothetical protein